MSCAASGAAVFAAAEITVRRVLTDNGSCYRSRLWLDTLVPNLTRQYT